MHVRVRLGARQELVVLPSRLSGVAVLRSRLAELFQLPPARQRLLYGGKLLEDGCTLHDYNIKLNDVIQLMPISAEATENISISKQNKSEDCQTEKDDLADYRDGISEFYKIGDIVDIKHTLCGWLEGKIVKIFTNSALISKPEEENTKDKRKDELMKSPKVETAKTNNGATKSPVTPNGTKRGIKDYFSKGSDKFKNNSPNKLSNGKKESTAVAEIDYEKLKTEEELHNLFRVQLDEEDDVKNCKLSQIRPRARNELTLNKLEINKTFMVNHNLEEPNEKGFWYDFTLHEIKKLRKHTELYGTLYHGDGILLNDIKIKCVDKMFTIETLVPLRQRSKSYDEMMSTETERRSRPLNCTTCRDVPDSTCKDCGCNICAGKNLPDQIILCDECNLGFHLSCLDPPLTKLPEEDWYCLQCRRDTDDIIAPGKAKQQRKTNVSKTKRDWGRGMACVGKTQTCAMPANHFGPIPGIEVGMSWRFRIQLSESGVHRPPVSGIHGRDVDGAYSIVLSGGYEDDVDNGFEFTYTGSGGRDLSGNKRTADQSSDQTLTRENRALARSCAVKDINEEGANAKLNWKNGKPIRVVRSYKMLKHFPQYAPKEGIRYDGIYKVVKYYPETGKSGFRVWKYLLRRDDPHPAPWEKNAKKFDIVYPDGYLEAEAAKQALKDKEKNKNGQKRKRILRDSNGASDDTTNDKKIKNNKRISDCNDSPPSKKMKTRSSIPEKSYTSDEINNIIGNITPKSRKRGKTADKKSPNSSVNPFTIAARKNDISPKLQNENIEPEILTKEERAVIKKDELNNKLWDECLTTLKVEGKQGFISKVSTFFLCIICQEVAVNPITTNCSHNFCIACLKLAFKSTDSKNCPSCRADLSKEEVKQNDLLKSALRVVMPGYDSGKK